MVWLDESHADEERIPRTMATRASSHDERRLADARAEHEASLRSLEEQLDRLVSQANEHTESDFSEEGGDPDGGVVERDRLRASIADEREHLDALERAEAALQQGTYGICRVCGEEIPGERLEVLPATTLCVRCKAAGHQP